MTDIKVHKSGEDQLKQFGIGVTTKDTSKVRISGAVIRIEVKPGEYVEPEYKVSVWVPQADYTGDKEKQGGRQFELDTKNSTYIGFKDFMAALYEAATGVKPRNKNESIEVELFGFAATIKESERDSTTLITESVDPTKEVQTPTVKAEAKAEVLEGQIIKVEGKDGVVRKHDNSCNCDQCRQIRQALREMNEGTNRGTSLNADNYRGYA